MCHCGSRAAQVRTRAHAVCACACACEWGGRGGRGAGWGRAGTVACPCLPQPPRRPNRVRSTAPCLRVQSASGLRGHSLTLPTPAPGLLSSLPARPPAAPALLPTRSLARPPPLPCSPHPQPRPPAAPVLLPTRSLARNSFDDRLLRPGAEGASSASLAPADSGSGCAPWALPAFGTPDVAEGGGSGGGGGLLHRHSVSDPSDLSGMLRWEGLGRIESVGHAQVGEPGVACKCGACSGGKAWGSFDCGMLMCEVWGTCVCCGAWDSYVLR